MLIRLSKFSKFILAILGVQDIGKNCEYLKVYNEYPLPVLKKTAQMA